MKPIRTSGNVVNQTTEDALKSVAAVPLADDLQVSASALDSSFDEIAAELDQEEGVVFDLDADEPIKTGSDVAPTMTLIDSDSIRDKGLTAANEVIPPKRGPGRPPKNIKVEQVNPHPEEKTARPATEIDLENLDETMIMDMPQIKAASFEIINLLSPKPKDKSIRFRWANYKNDVAGNLSTLYALGYQTASKDDIDLEKTPLHQSMFDGSQVKYLDIMLLKIPVLRLMALYKANMLKSVNRLVKARERGLGEANRNFKESLLSVPGAMSEYNAAKAKLGGKEPVSFYVPGAEESQFVGR